MSYELSVGGRRDDAASDVYTSFDSLDVTRGASSMDTWSATLPIDTSFEDVLYEDIYVYYEDSIVFHGGLESFEVDYESATTTISGRGMLAELDRTTDVYTFQDTKVYDAIDAVWADTGFDATTLPPSRALFDEDYTSYFDHQSLWSAGGARQHSIEQDNWDVVGNELVAHQTHYTDDLSIANTDTDTDAGQSVSNSAYSQGEGIRLEADGYVEWTVDTDYAMDAYVPWLRLQTSPTSAVLDVYVDGTHVGSVDPTASSTFSNDELPHDWYDATGGGDITAENAPPTIDGETTIRIEATGLPGDGSEWVDVEAGSVTDENRSYTLPDSVNADGVYDGPQWYPDSNTLDDRNSDDEQYPSIWIEGGVDWLGMVVETTEPVSEIDLCLKRVAYDGETETVNGIDETIWQTVSHGTAQYLHFASFEFSTSERHFRPALEVDSRVPDTQSVSGESGGVDVTHAEVFAPDPNDFVQLDDVELDGTLFEILQELHDLGAYEFVVTDYETERVESFPHGTIAHEPDWRVVSSTRSIDLTDYANSVTVHGRKADDGTVYSASASDQDEIDEFGQEVEKFEKNPELETQSEVDTRAQRLLEASIGERDESGSLEIVPQQVTPGYTYNVSAWGDAFPYGQLIGSNALYFRGGDSPGDDPDHVFYEWYNTTYSKSGPCYTLEFLLHPEGISDLGDEEFYTVFYVDETDGGDAFVRLYGNGSVEFDETTSGWSPNRTDSGVIREGQTQRLSVQLGENTNDRRCYVDGELVFEGTGTAAFLDLDACDFYIGCDTAIENPYTGGIDDLRFWAEDTFRTQQWIRENRFADLTVTGEDLSQCDTYLRFEDHTDTTQLVNDGRVQNFESSVNGAQYQMAFGKLDEVQYSFGTGDTISLDFNIAGRLDTELVRTKRTSQSVLRSL